ncbi:MAG: hypothetical protein V5A59_10750 [Bacteroidales bacterium]|nr:hypothetical protein [Bacteroidales bacterium]MBS3774612.1 hypothetical protein [Bacteroidales bacterium]
MEQNGARIHLKVGEIEFSIEGSPEYVKKQYNQMAKDLNLKEKLAASEQKEEPITKKAAQTAKTGESAPKKDTKESTKDDFGEWLSRLPQGLKNRDKIMVAGYFNQLRSKDHVFRVRDINNILKDHGINITNPSSLINNVVKSQNILRQVSRQGRQKYFQLTKEGEKYIRDLLSAQNK